MLVRLVFCVCRTGLSLYFQCSSNIAGRRMTVMTVLVRLVFCVRQTGLSLYFRCSSNIAGRGGGD